MPGAHPAADFLPASDWRSGHTASHSAAFPAPAVPAAPAAPAAAAVVAAVAAAAAQLY